ncbi:NAD(P)H-dependent glycerol-3-phosphate dehydrogenase [bacterium]|nr:NAD(P)H-dependent glycerol-3-phosphate dehydrogenase [bacterium]
MGAFPKVAVIGGGSWATALVKVLSENLDYVGWWMRSEESVLYIKRYHNNPRYLPGLELATENIDLSTDLNHLVEEAELLLFAIPSAFLKDALLGLNPDALEGKFIASAIKGIVPDERLIVGEFFLTHYRIPEDQIAVITGPCHAEEVALERLSYLTIASTNPALARHLAEMLKRPYIKTLVSDDIYGTEYSAVLKNIYAVAAGICHGLGYGDNFQAVLVSSAVREIKRFIKSVHPIKRNILGSAYLGDLLVTAYSQFSRNRLFGTMIGKGYSVRSAQLEMNMIAEGYYAARLVEEIRREHEIKMPVAQAVYRVLFEGRSPKKEMAKLSTKLH